MNNYKKVKGNMADLCTYALKEGKAITPSENVASDTLPSVQIGNLEMPAVPDSLPTTSEDGLMQRHQALRG